MANKAELLGKMRQGWDDLNTYLDTLSEAQATQRSDAAGWTVKDHTTHLARWEGSMNTVLQKQPRWEGLGLTHAAWTRGGDDWLDYINEAMRQLDLNLTWAQARQAFAEVHVQLIGRIEEMTDADLQRPYSDYQAGSAQHQPMTMRLGIASYEHYEEHLPWMQAIAEGEKGE